ncbi:MAG: RNA-binding S4 domain-containing protein [Clostridia bacterium]|nr:RNA-binding S4 domain-containing protein [Oscillospiraceae bacterium]MBR6693479.1 RNA-binding S4 domain-containing protein [Clostridia bacterium]
MEKVSINGEYIKLDSLLKLAGLVYTGGQAKMEILDGNVSVNGEVCLMRGKKIRRGDTVLFDGVEIVIE